jgi:WD40 repeat protein
MKTPKASRLLLIILLIFLVKTADAQIGSFVIPSGHSSSVLAVKLDLQGKYLYSLEREKVIMWDAKTQQQLYTFLLNESEVKDLIISHDGNKIAIVTANRIRCFSTVSGKQLFKTSRYYLTCAAFSRDDSQILSIYEGLISINSQTGEEKQLMKFDFDWLQSKIEVLSATEILLHNKTEVQRWNMATGKMVSAFKLPAPVFRHTYLPQYGYLASNSNTTSLEIRKIDDGTLIKTIPIAKTDYTLIPSSDTKELLLSPGAYEQDPLTLYNASLNPVKEIKSAVNTTAGDFSGSTGKLLSARGSDISLIEIKSNKTLARFKRQVADLGSDIFTSLNYNHNQGVLNILTDDSVYKSINLVKLMPFRHQKLKDGQLSAFSPTGDTVAVFGDHKTYIKNVKTGKMLWPLLKFADELAGDERTNYFFSNSGSSLYYSTFSIPKQLTSFNKLDIKTGLSKSIFSYHSLHDSYLTEDKDLLSAIDVGYKVAAIKVWNLLTGKIVFQKPLTEDSYPTHTSISKDKKQLMVVDLNVIYTYELATGKLLSQNKAKFTTTKGLYASSPDQSMVFLAEDEMLSAVGAKGEPLYRVKSHSAPVRRILFSPNGKIIYTVARDQSIKVWEAEKGTLLGTLYLFNDGNDFVFLDAYGRFDGTQGGINRMYYYSNRVKVKLDVVYEAFYTPNLYQRLVNGERFSPIEMAFNPMPIAKLSYEQKTRNLNVEDDVPSYTNTTGLAELTIKATAENDKIDEVRLFHNGKAVSLTTRGLFVTDNNSATESKTYTINLMPGINTFRAVALNSQRTESLPDEIVVNYQPPANAAVQPAAPSNSMISQIEKSATLHLIVVGINTYKNSKLSLNYALADATSFKSELEAGAKTLITNTKTYFITDAQADKKAITDAFAQVKKQAKPQDVFIFYYAGHGVIADKQKEFYLVPTDVDDLKNVDEILKEKGIAAKLIQEYAIDIQAQKQLFILDACQSAGAFQQLLSAEANQQKSISMVARSTGTHWMAASGAQQFANEFSQLGHGAFTYVLLQALRGEAAANKMITVNGLKNFLQLKVPELMKKYNGSAQYPASYGSGSDFPVELLK